MGTREDYEWDAEQDHAELGPRPPGGYPEDEPAEADPIPYYRHSIVEPPIWGAMDEHDPRL